MAARPLIITRYNSKQSVVSSSGFSFNVAYTFSKLIDNGSEIFSLGSTATLQNASVPAIGIAANTGSTRRRPGNLGRNTERGPGLKNCDVNIVKNTRINERFNLEFRAEFYNIFNTPMDGKVSVSPFCALAGRANH
jgi:hypothetical protein